MMKDSIKKFVQQTLGCNCPEEVFKIIDCGRDIVINKDIMLAFKINIGNRLLVYIIDVDNSNTVEENLDSIVEYGKDERDRKGFNRFRLVLSAEINEDSVHSIIQSFNDSKKYDDRMHLHVVEKDTLMQLNEG